MECDTNKILVVLTGGTICSSTDVNGKRYSDANNVRIVENYKDSHPVRWDDIQFEQSRPLDILSENMTIDTWNILLQYLKTVRWERYKGVILLHGTDTLAYTASLLSILLTGIPIPVCLVSSQLPLDHAATNGHANFRTAVDLIMSGIKPNVYVVYRNSDGAMYLHFGAHLLQCPNYSEDFHSIDETKIPDCDGIYGGQKQLPTVESFYGKRFESDHIWLYELGELVSCVLCIAPYVGIRYDNYRLDNIRAILHSTYHSESVCVERKQKNGMYTPSSILYLADRCRERKIPLFLEPCSVTAYHYESTGDALSGGAVPIWGMTSEMAYIKALVGCTLGLTERDLVDFMRRSINYEIIR